MVLLKMTIMLLLVLLGATNDIGKLEMQISEVMALQGLLVVKPISKSKWEEIQKSVLVIVMVLVPTSWCIKILVQDIKTLALSF
jgi:hypothetical protein